MKKSLIFLGCLAMLLTFSFTGCTPDPDDTPTPVPADTITALVPGSWTVTYFWDRDEDETADFAGWTLTFETDGTLIVTNGTDTYTGTWSFDDSPDDDLTEPALGELILAITGPNPVDELPDDWNILQLDDSVMKLKDISGGDGHIDELHLARL